MRNRFLWLPLLLLLLASVPLAGDTVVEEIVARINNQIVTRSEIQRAREQLQAEMQQQFGAGAEKEFSEREKDVLRDLIDQALLIQRGKDMGITADVELVKRLDDDRFAIKATPRKPASKWSDINRRRWAELKTAGVLMPAGLAAAPTGNKYAPKPDIPELPGYIGKALKSHPAAWSFFQTLPHRERRNFVVWIHIAKRPETRERRIGESLALLAAGRKLGLK